MNPEVGGQLSDWAEAPPLIIDESEATLEALPTALKLGYRGTSHKNCKGIVKGIVNACLLAHRRRTEEDPALILSGEDLANVGPVALLQDLVLMAHLGIDHVERNGHHYFRGLSMYPEDVQAQVLADHEDLYKRHADGFATLRIDQGRLNLSSLLAAPFGPASHVEVSRFEPLDAWVQEGVG